MLEYHFRSQIGIRWCGAAFDDLEVLAGDAQGPVATVQRLVTVLEGLWRAHSDGLRCPATLIDREARLGGRGVMTSTALPLQEILGDQPCRDPMASDAHKPRGDARQFSKAATKLSDFWRPST